MRGAKQRSNLSCLTTLPWASPRKNFVATKYSLLNIKILKSMCVCQLELLFVQDRFQFVTFTRGANPGVMFQA